MTTQGDLAGYALALDELARRLDYCTEAVSQQLSAVREGGATIDANWSGVLPTVTALHADAYADGIATAPAAVGSVASTLRAWAAQARRIAADAPTSDEDPYYGRHQPSPGNVAKVAWDAACTTAINDISPALNAISELCAIDYVRASDEPYNSDQLNHFGLAGLPLAGLFEPPDDGSFSENLWGIDPSMFDLDLATIAKEVYDYDGWFDPDRVVGDGWMRVPPWELPDGVELEDFEDDNGFRAALYTDGNGNYVLAYAGTELTSGGDWWNNLTEGGGFSAGQYDHAVELANRLHEVYGDDLGITGHSLGGGLATTASLATGAPAVVFNSAGVNDDYRDELGVDTDSLDDQIRHYHTDGDILTWLQDLTPVNDAIGTQYVVESPSHNPLSEHGQQHVIDALEDGNFHLEPEARPPQPHHQLPEPYDGPTEPPEPSPGPSPEPYPTP